MTALAAVLIVSGLLFAFLFAVGVVAFFGMILHAEISAAKASRTAESRTEPARARTTARPAGNV